MFLYIYNKSSIKKLVVFSDFLVLKRLLNNGSTVVEQGRISNASAASKGTAIMGSTNMGSTTDGPPGKGKGMATMGSTSMGSTIQGMAIKGIAAKGMATEGDAAKVMANKGRTTKGPGAKGMANKGRTTKGSTAKGIANKGRTTKGVAAKEIAANGMARGKGIVTDRDKLPYKGIVRCINYLFAVLVSLVGFAWLPRWFDTKGIFNCISGSCDVGNGAATPTGRY